MTLSRVTSMLGAIALGAVLVASTYGVQAASGRDPHPATEGRHGPAPASTHSFHAPIPHPYGANGMRMGMHCDDHDLS